MWVPPYSCEYPLPWQTWMWVDLTHWGIPLETDRTRLVPVLVWVPSYPCEYPLTLANMNVSWLDTLRYPPWDRYDWTCSRTRVSTTLLMWVPSYSCEYPLPWRTWRWVDLTHWGILLETDRTGPVLVLVPHPDASCYRHLQMRLPWGPEHLKWTIYYILQVNNVPFRSYEYGWIYRNNKFSTW